MALHLIRIPFIVSLQGCGLCLSYATHVWSNLEAPFDWYTSCSWVSGINTHIISFHRILRGLEWRLGHWALMGPSGMHAESQSSAIGSGPTLCADTVRISPTLRHRELLCPTQNQRPQAAFPRYVSHCDPPSAVLRAIRPSALARAFHLLHPPVFPSNYPSAIQTSHLFQQASPTDPYIPSLPQPLLLVEFRYVMCRLLGSPISELPWGMDVFDPVHLE